MNPASQEPGPKGPVYSEKGPSGLKKVARSLSVGPEGLSLSLNNSPALQGREE